MKTIRVALIGCGAIATSGHVPSLLCHDRFTIASLCDVNRAAAEKLAGACGDARPRVVSDYRQALEGVDACILALRPEHSVDVAVDLLRRGIPVLDEKPLAVTVADGQRVARAVAETGVAYQVGFVFRYAPMFQDVARWTRAFAYPRVYEVGVYDERPSQHAHDVMRSIQSVLSRSSAVTHEGSHVFDWITLLGFGPMKTVRATAVKTRGEFAGPNHWTCLVDDVRGSTMQLNIGWLLEDQPRSTLRVLSDTGRLELDLFSGEGELACGGKVEPVRCEPMQQAWSVQLDHFAHAVQTGELRGATVQDGLSALEATTGCERSAREGCVVGLGR